MKKLNDWTRKELMALPNRNWNESSTYDSVLVMSTRFKHESGWAMMAIIGVRNGQPVEIASQCTDDIMWNTKEPIRTDCAHKSGAVNFWSGGSQFVVGSALSSVNIRVVPHVKTN